MLLAGYLFVVGVFGFRSGALTLADIGWPVGKGAGRWLVDFGIGAVMLFVVAIVDWRVGPVLTARSWERRPPDVDPRAQRRPLTSVFVAVGACLLIPIGEELLFRGYSVTAWLTDLGARSALIRGRRSLCASSTSSTSSRSECPGRRRRPV